MAVTEDRFLVSAQRQSDRPFSPISSIWVLESFRDSETRQTSLVAASHSGSVSSHRSGIAARGCGSDPKRFRIVEVRIRQRLCRIGRAVFSSFHSHGVSDSQARWLAFSPDFTGSLRNVSPFVRTRFPSGAYISSRDWESPLSYSPGSYGNYAVILVMRDPGVGS